MSCRTCHLCVWRLLLAMLLALMVMATVQACPFCTVESLTLTEEIQAAEAVVLAKFVAEAPPATPDAPNTGLATFEVQEVIRGDDRISPGQKIQVVYFGDSDRDKTFFISGVGFEGNKLEWATPLPLGAAAVDYVRKLQTVPASGADRIAFFQDYFENDDPLLAQDAYDEFARAPYADLKALKPRMKHDELVAWINSDVNPSRRRLYLTMLGVCGGPADIPMLEKLLASDFSEMQPIAAQLAGVGMALGGPIAVPAWIEKINLDERRKKIGLDAIVAAYLMLDHGAGMPLVERRFLTNKESEYGQTYSTIMALRTLGEETDAVPRDKLMEAMRLLLDDPRFAEQVIPDLSRWEDWSVLDRLVAMYKAGDEKSYVRPPIVTYLTVASEQPGDVGERGKAALAELTALDPKGVKQAQSLAAFGFLARARSTSPATGAQRPTADNDGSSKTAAPTDTREFNATPEEMAAADAAQPEDFADPTSYADAPTASPDDLADTAGDDVAEDEESPADGTASEPTAAEQVEENTATVTAEPAAVAVAPIPAPPAAIYHRSLVIGVPLAAAGVLAVVYWLILRWGAV